MIEYTLINPKGLVDVTFDPNKHILKYPLSNNYVSL